MSAPVAHCVYHAWKSSGIVADPAPDHDGDVIVKHIGDVQFRPGLVQAVISTDVPAEDAARMLRKVAAWIELQAASDATDKEVFG